MIQEQDWQIVTSVETTCDEGWASGIALYQWFESQLNMPLQPVHKKIENHK